MKIFSLVFLLFFSTSFCFGQELNTKHVSNLLSLEPLVTSKAQMLKNPKLDLLQIKVADMPFFCRMEAKLDKKAGFPIRIRLGEVNQVERKEGKPYSPFLID